jgi:hypothetical protein
LGNSNLFAAEVYKFSTQIADLKSANITYIEDKTSTLGINEIIALFNKKTFSKSNNHVPNLGYKNFPVWFHVSFQNLSNAEYLLLELDFANYNEVDFLFCDSSFKVLQFEKQGVYNLSHDTSSSTAVQFSKLKRLQVVPITYFSELKVMHQYYSHYKSIPIQVFLKKRLHAGNFLMCFLG